MKAGQQGGERERENACMCVCMYVVVGCTQISRDVLLTSDKRGMTHLHDRVARFGGAVHAHVRWLWLLLLLCIELCSPQKRSKEGKSGI